MAILGPVIIGLGAVVAAIIGSASSSETSDDQLAAAKEARDLDFKLAEIKRQDELKASRETMLFNRQSLKQQKELTLAGLGQRESEFSRNIKSTALQGRLGYFNSIIAGNTQLQNNLAALWKRG